ncbi:MAG: hypothetical protein KC442_05475 [Thermomicrobiales bacterium]|nr:hypothetical protein [Thermomicrobiales bacterium]
MDANHFDALTRCLTSGGPRRRVLRLLAATPVVGGALALLPGDALAKDRRRRRKLRHKRRHNAGGRQGKRCRKKSTATVCAGQCGLVKNRKSCGKSVDCTLVCTSSGSVCCDGGCQTLEQLQAACPASGAPGFLIFDDGAMRCASAAIPACTCLGGVYRACAPGTVCVPNGTGILCSFPDSQAPE